MALRADFDEQQIRQLTAMCYRCQHMPSRLWHGGLTDELPRALSELPDLHVVHVALMMASLDLREPKLLLQEVAEEIEQRVPSLDATGLTGAAVALSQLGPWPEPVPGVSVF